MNPNEWRDALITKRVKQNDGTVTHLPVKSIANAITILGNDDRWSNVLAYDELAERVVTKNPPPWHEHDSLRDIQTGAWRDDDTTRTTAWLAREFRLDFGFDHIMAAITTVARLAPFHPVREYLDGLQWDGTVRLNRVLPQYFGATDTAYSRAIGTRWLIAAVARTHEAGCKVDCVPVLEGTQGLGKSRALRILARRDEWFLDSDLDIGSKDAAQSLRGKWIAELPEMSSTSRAAVEATKAFVSRQIDSYRPSYGRTSQDFPRRCVFAGTTNSDRYLRDETGNRRWWPIRCGTIDLAGLTRDRDQLWAEAVVRYEAREAWHVDTAELAALCAEEQDERFAADPWEELIGKWLDDNRVLLAREGYVTTTRVLTDGVGVPKDRLTRGEEMRAAAVLARLGWAKGKQRRIGGIKVRPYLAPIARVDVTEVGTEPSAETNTTSPLRHNRHIHDRTHTHEKEGSVALTTYVETGRDGGDVGTARGAAE